MNNCKNIIVHFVCALGVAAGISYSGLSVDAAHAQGSLLQETPRGKDKQPLMLQADHVTYDNQNRRVIAKGNVEIYYNKHGLFADNVIYDQSKNTLSASGNVRIKEPSGAVVTTDKIELSDDFREGFIDSLKIITKEDTRIAASSAQRVDENTTVFKKAIFTPCKLCKDNPTPLWSIKAGKIIHKKDEKNIYYEDAALEFFGFPVAYLPYFSHPDPTVKKRSGFLIPTISHSSELGLTVEVPYFYNLAPNKDFTVSPKYTDRGLFLKGQWRHRTRTGAYEIEAGGIWENEDEFRGTLQTRGAFKPAKNWKLGWDITAETDDTVRRVYELDQRTVTNRVSQIFARKQTERNWFEAKLYHFGALTALDGSNAEAFVHPIVDYNHIFATPVIGGELSFDANAMALSRADGADTSRLVTQLKWRRTLVDSLGQVYEPFFQARGDIYHVTNGELSPEPVDSGFKARAQGVAGLTYKYPLIARTGGGTHTITPIGQIAARPDVQGSNDVPNEDARSLVFDDTLLFDVDKFSGYDRLETGVRANIGLSYIWQSDNGGYAKAVLGKSFHIAGENSFDAGTGLDTDGSDVVAGLYLEPSANFMLVSQARFDEEDLSVKRTDVYLRGAYGPVQGSVNYANIDSEADQGISEDRQEILAAGSLQISDYWSVFGNLRYNITDDQFIEDELGLKYADECFVLAVSYNESFIEEGDLKADQRVMVRFELKHLGGTSFETNIPEDAIGNPNQS